MKKFLYILFLLCLSLPSFGQSDSYWKPLEDINNTYKRDSLRTHTDRFISAIHIQELFEGGAIVLRLNLHKKNADLYRASGDIKLADKIDKKLKERNLALTNAFLGEYFTFCPVYIIESKNYGKVLNGQKSGYFLNKNLEIDTSIVFNHTNYLFLEYGTVYETVNKANSFSESETTSTPLIYESLVFKTPGMVQLNYPFPYYINPRNFTVDLKSIIRLLKGDAYMSNLSKQDSLKIGSKIYHVNDIENFNCEEDDHLDLSGLRNYVKFRKNKTKLLDEHQLFFSNKNEYNLYLKKMNFKEAQKNKIQKIWELQVHLYAYYMQSQRHKTNLFFEEKFNYPFDVPTCINSNLRNILPLK